jgi:hypothetical protein
MTTQTDNRARKFSGTLNFPEPVKGGETALRRAGIDWTVRAEPLDSHGFNGGDRFVAAVRDSDDLLIGVNGTRHEIIQNSALAEWGDTIIQMNAGFKYTGGGAFPNGDKSYLTLTGERTLKFGSNDDIGFNAIMLVNDFAGNSPLVAIGYTGRLWCTNQIAGIARGRKKGTHRIARVAHTRSAGWKITAAKDALREAVHEMDAVEEELQRLIKVTMTEQDAIQVAVGPRPDEDAPARSHTTWEQKFEAFRAELNADWNLHLKGTALGAVMAAQGVDEHLSRSADRDKARVDRVIAANYPTMKRLLAAV